MEYISNPERVTYFAKTDARNKLIPFGIKAKDRTRHVYVIGKTGMGKSTCLENMAVQDIKNGEGFCFIDPHGATAELLLEYIPEDRVKDVLYFAPFDLDYPVSFNVMEDVGYDKRHLVVSGLMSAFKKIWIDAWSARMEYILTNTLLALLEYPDATMLGVNKMYTDKNYRKKVIEYVKDPLVKSFWVDEFATYTDRYTQEATPAIQNKIGQFTGNPLIRNIVGQAKSTFDLREMVDNRKILIVNLSKGRVGEVNANLLGSMLITKLYLAAMSRADVSPRVLERLPNFYFYVDEFQSFANESFADILSEARKYKLNLTMAHQYIEQMSEEVRDAVFGNVGTMITFRVGAYDAEVLEKEFMPQFTAQDLVNLGFAQIYLKLMIDGVGSQPFSAETLPPVARPEVSCRDAVIEHSRKMYAHSRADIEASVREEYTSQRQIEMGEKSEKKQQEWQERRAMRAREEARGGSEGGAPRREPPRDFRESREPRESQERREFRPPRPLYQGERREPPRDGYGARRSDAERMPDRGGAQNRERERRDDGGERPPPRRPFAPIPPAQSPEHSGTPKEALKREEPSRVIPNGNAPQRMGGVNEPSKSRGPTEKNVSSLKEALAQALKQAPLRSSDTVGGRESEERTVSQHAPKMSEETRPAPKEHSAEQKREREVPPPATENTQQEQKKETPKEPRGPADSNSHLRADSNSHLRHEISRDVLENILREDEPREE